MSQAISWLLQLKVREGQLDTARTLMHEMVSGTCEEPGAQIYEWFLSEDETLCHIYERYADSDAAMTHAGTFGTRYAERFFGCFEVESFCIYGNPSAELKGALGSMGATFFSSLEGFHKLTRGLQQSDPLD